MSRGVRQYGRRDGNNGGRVNGVRVPPPSISSQSASRWRYVLEAPAGATTRTSRPITNISQQTKTTTMNDIIVDHAMSRNRLTDASTHSNVTTRDVYSNKEGQHLSPKEYFYRNETEAQSSVPRHVDDAWITQFVDSDIDYSTSTVENQEVQALIRAPPKIRRYPLNVDVSPELIVHSNTQQLPHTQDNAVRYLRPRTPPPPGSIITRKIRAPPSLHTQPNTLRQQPHRPRTSSSVSTVEKSPARAKYASTTVNKTSPPRKWILERPNLPSESRSVQMNKVGVQRPNPQRYNSQYKDSFYTTEFVSWKTQELESDEEKQQQASLTEEETLMEQNDEYNGRQIHHNYTQICDSSADFHQYLEAFSGLPPVGKSVEGQLAKLPWTFVSGESLIGESPIGESLIGEERVTHCYKAFFVFYE
ncbi:unnamed protein product [Didymodactylos carnosus]|uniref:Uncharacterized protein n=1 Tax=Didymodactylos carnosus TaxID=1234261 RepID=A0A8S2Q0B2_9BILA|nr:unnamed protein product [Didymodactylos carnosus]CAF4080643.1 unnamed protein product [Didymodactylos carnosus]